MQLSGENKHIKLLFGVEMIVTSQQLKEHYAHLSDINGKISRDVKNGFLYPLVKGIYETDGNVHGSRLAQFIYGPSYLSFDYALCQYGLIPEAVYNTFTCATFNKKKIKKYNNHFGTFIYRDVPSQVFYLDVYIFTDGQYSYHIASKEKALCDKLYTVSPVRNIKKFKELLFDDLRIDRDEFDKLNKNNLLQLAPLYHSTNLNLLVKLIKGE